MNHTIVDIVQVKFSTRGSNVSFLVVIAFKVAIDTCSHGICANIKLSSIVQKRVVDILLNYTGSLSRLCALFYDSFDIIVFFCNLDPLSSICVLSRFYNPHIELIVVLPILIVVSELGKVWV